VAIFNESIDQETLTLDDVEDGANIQKIYEYSLYNPKNTIGAGSTLKDPEYSTFESLNGDLGQTNIKVSFENDRTYDDGFLRVATPGTPARGLISSENFKVGTFARGYFYGFNFPDRYHESQFTQNKIKLMSITATSPKRFFVSSYSLCADIFIPYNSVVFITYQGFFTGESIKKESNMRDGVDNTHKYYGNRFNHHLYVNGKRYGALESTAPASKPYSSADMSPFEYRWRWCNRTKMIYLPKGYHSIEVCIEGVLPHLKGLTAGSPDTVPDKLQHRCGSISVLAIKSANKYSGKKVPTWSYVDISNSDDAITGSTTDDIFDWSDVDPWVFEDMPDLADPVVIDEGGDEGITIGDAYPYFDGVSDLVDDDSDPVIVGDEIVTIVPGTTVFSTSD